ncbi:MAG: MFS transporter [Acidimicrobiia bacterium]
MTTAAPVTSLTKLEPTPEMLQLEAEIGEVESKLPNYSKSILTVIMLLTVLEAFDRSMFSTVQEDVRRHFRLSDFQISWLTGAFGAVAALAVVPLGFVTDRMKRVSILALGLIPWAFGMAGQGVATSFAMLFVFRMFLGALEPTGGQRSPAVNSLLADYYPVPDRQIVFGRLAIATILGYAAGPILGGLTAYWWGWQKAFIFWGGVGVAYFFVVRAALPEPPRGLQDALHRMTTRYQRLRLEQRRAAGAKVRAAMVGTNGDLPVAAPSVPLEVIRDELEMPLAEGFDYRELTSKQAIREVLRIKSLWLIYIGFAFTAFNGSLMATWPATFYRRYHGVSVVGAGLITGLNALTAIIGIMLTTKIATALIRRGKANYRVLILTVCFGGSAVFWALAFYADFTPISLHFFVLGSILATGPTALLFAMQADLVNPYLRGRSAAIASVLGVVGTISAPIILGLISTEIGLRYALIVGVLPVGLVGAVVVLPALKIYERDALHQQRETVRQARLELALRDDLGTAPAAPMNGH